MFKPQKTNSSYARTCVGKFLRLLIDPVVRGLLPGLDLAVLEPEGDLLLGILDAIAAVADVAANILRKSAYILVRGAI